MERQKRKQKGITLIALVISIIVMLILAGVSLNMTIGENGIITQAQNATVLQGCAELEEFLKEYYVSNFGNLPQDAKNKAEALQLYSKSSSWIYNPSKDGVGSLSYVITKDGDACYFIDKNGFENSNETNIKLKGGDAIDGSYSNYVNMNDVYGVTGDLQVYYCANGKDSMVNMAKEDLDQDDISRVVFEKGSAFARLINNGDPTKDVTASEARSLTELQINNEVTDLNELYNFSNLKTLKLNGYNGSLEGIDKAPLLTDIYMNQCNIPDYSYIGKIGSRLKKLLLFRMGQDELNKLCSLDKGIAKYDLSNLQYFGCMYDYFDEFSINDLVNARSQKKDNSTNVTDISCLANLSSSTKNSIRYLFLHNNNIEDISALKEFSGVYWLRIEGNKIKTLNGLQLMSELTYLFASYNQLGTGIDGTVKDPEKDSLSYLQGLNRLYYIDLYNNDNIIYVGYLANKNTIYYLDLNNNINIDSIDIQNIKSVLKTCGSNGKIPPKYSLALLDDNTTLLNISGQSVDKDVFIGLKTKTKIDKLNINSIKLLDENESEITDKTIINNAINEMLSGLVNLKYLTACDIPGLTTIDFATKTPKLVELDIFNTGITNLSNLNSITTMGTLAINNKDIVLSGINGIEQTISRLKESKAVWFNNEYGLISYNFELTKKLEDCTNITKLVMYQHNHRITGEKLDLSRCTKLTSILSCRVITKIILPSSIKTVTCTYETNAWDFSKCSQIQVVSWDTYDYYNAATIKDFFSTLSNSTSLNAVTIKFKESSIKDLSFLDIFKGCTNLKSISLNGCYNGNTSLLDTKGIGNLTSLESLTMSGFYNLKTLTDISKLANLTNLKITEGKIQDISGVSNLVLLKNLNLSGNNISNVYALQNLRHLGEKISVDSNGNDVFGSVNLTKNALSDYSSFYVDESGKTISISTLECLVKMKQNSSALQNLYLDTNGGIIDFSPLTSIGWNTNGKFNN